MRVYEEPIEVRRGPVPGPGEPGRPLEGPAQFLWRDQLWVVRSVQTRWLETGPWWDSAAARAVRNGGVELVDGEDILGEEETWRVVAASGRERREGVYELTYSWAGGSWRLSRVVD